MATVAIAAWEGDIDRNRAHAVLDGTYSPEDEPLSMEGLDPVTQPATAVHAQS